MGKIRAIALKITFVLAAIYLTLLLLAHSVFILLRMGGNSMSPVIKSNDLVVATCWFRVASLHNGDLVVADFAASPSPIRTIRRIEQQKNTPNGQFYLLASETNGLDSRFTGPLSSQAIRGKIIWIIKGKK